MTLDRAAQYALALSLIGLGVMGVASGDFAFQWQAVPKELPLRQPLAIVCGVVEVLAGIAVVAWPAKRWGLAIAAGLYTLWTLTHVPLTNFDANAIGAWLGVAEPLFVATGVGVAALSLTATTIKHARVAAIVLGACMLIFGASHFKYADFTASMIPTWIPGALFWAWFTGAAHTAAGLAAISGVWARRALYCEGLMMAGFVVLLHIPRIIGAPSSRLEWTMGCVALGLAAAAVLAAPRVSKHA